MPLAIAAKLLFLLNYYLFVQFLIRYVPASSQGLDEENAGDDPAVPDIQGGSLVLEGGRLRNENVQIAYGSCLVLVDCQLPSS